MSGLPLSAFLFSFVLVALNLFATTVIPSKKNVQDPQILNFYPQGIHEQIRQVKVQFSEEMTPFGQVPNLSPPFDIQCTPQQKGHPRWVDPLIFVYDFAGDLPGGVECQFTLQPQLKTHSGKPIVGKKKFYFSTGGPTVLDIRPWDGTTQISEDQTFILFLNSPANAKTVLENAYFTVEGLEEKIGVNIIDQKSTKAVLKTLYLDPTQEKMFTLGLTAKQTFPFNSKVQLVWGKGITPANSAIATQVEKIYKFQTRDKFTVSFSCSRQNFNSPCNPLTPVYLNFSSPVSWSMAKKLELVSPQGRIWKVVDQEQEEVYSVEFRGPFSGKEKFTIQLPQNFQDVDGRKPVNEQFFPMTVEMGEVPSLAKFAAPFGILEWTNQADQPPALPLTIRNIEAKSQVKLLNKHKMRQWKKTSLKKTDPPLVIHWLQILHRHQRTKKSLHSLLDPLGPTMTESLELPEVKSTKEKEVIGIPLPEPGFYIVEIKSELLGQNYHQPPSPFFVTSSALVTKLSVHFKEGRDNSLVWVTDLQSGKPVANSKVSLWNCQGIKSWEGKTGPEGTAVINIKKDKMPSQECPGEKNSYAMTYEAGYFIFAEKDQDLSFVHTSWNEGIESWRFSLPYFPPIASEVSHTVLDRPLYRPGEKVFMKHFIRQHTLKGPKFLEAKKLPKTVEIIHLGSEQKYILPVKWQKNGQSESEWPIPREAKLGTYRVFFQFKKSQEANEYSPYQENYAGEFLLEEFRVPLMKATIKTPDPLLIGSKEVPLQFWVEYLGGGGGASFFPVKLRVQKYSLPVAPIPDSLSPDLDFSDYYFNAGPVPPTTKREKEEVEDEDEDEEGSDETSTGYQTHELVLDKNGHQSFEISKIPVTDKVVYIQSELEFKDPSGETQTASRGFHIFPSPWLIGIKSPGNNPKPGRLQVTSQLVTVAGKPLVGAPIKLLLFKKKYFSHRKKIVGGFYSYENHEETTLVGPLCEGKTNQQGSFSCDQQVKEGGELIVQAEATDSQGKKIFTNRSFWIPGENQDWGGGYDHDRIDLIPLKKEYAPGEMAIFKVQMPFQEATVLYTIEREGILHHGITTITRKSPLLEIPIESHFVPNIYVSALLVRGRVEGIKPTALLDLGRPAYKIGLNHLLINHQQFRLQVKVGPDQGRTVYDVREKVKVGIQVRLHDGKVPPPGAELAIAAVDEGLLQLKQNTSWDVLQKMMAPRNLEVNTFTAQMQVIGKRHFGLKAAPQGGGGGLQNTRELFDTLLFWKAKISLDKNGNAQVEIPLNDSLTSFRIAAIASAGEQFFGTGSTTIKTNKDLLVFPGLPQMARQGDELEVEFTLKNTTQQKMDLQTTLQIQDTTTKAYLPTLQKNLVLEAGEGMVIPWKIKIPHQASELLYTFKAMLSQKLADSLQVRQKILSPIKVRPLQAILKQLQPDPQKKNGLFFSLSLQKPQKAVPHQGHIQVRLQQSLSSSLNGVQEYMKKYPYTCLEQKLSRSIALQDQKLWTELVSQLPTYTDQEGLVAYFPIENNGSMYGSTTLTSYLLTMAKESQYPLSVSHKERMILGLKNFIQEKSSGKTGGHFSSPFSDLTLRKLEAIHALSLYNEATPDMLDSLVITPHQWPTSTLLDWWSLLRRLKNQDLSKKYQQQAEDLIKDQLTQHGSFISFGEGQINFPWWLMVSPDLNSLRLISLLLEFRLWQKEIPLLVSGALHRQREGHWDLTTANAWGVLTFSKFSQQFEKFPLKGVSTVEIQSPQLPPEKKSLSWKSLATTSPKDKPYEFIFPFPQGTSTLNVHHSGQGNPWLSLQAHVAIPLKQPLFQGFQLRKVYLPIERKDSKTWSQGDIIRVQIDLTAQNDMTWVVVDDPIPAGAVILGKNIGGQSTLGAVKGKSLLWPSFEEKGSASYRSYYDFVPKGTWRIEYTIRPSTKGLFHLPPTRTEAMYLPDMNGELPNANFQVH